MRRGVTGWNTPKMTQNTRTQRQCVVAQRLPYCWFLCPPELTHTVIGLEMRVGVEEGPSAKSRLNDLSLLTESGPLISRPYLSTLVVSACHVSIWISPLSSRIDPAGKGEPAWTCSFVDSEQHWVPTRLELLSLKVQYNWCCNKTYEMTHAKVTRVCVYCLRWQRPARRSSANIPVTQQPWQNTNRRPEEADCIPGRHPQVALSLHLLLHAWVWFICALLFTSKKGGVAALGFSKQTAWASRWFDEETREGVEMHTWREIIQELLACCSHSAAEKNQFERCWGRNGKAWTKRRTYSRQQMI